MDELVMSTLFFSHWKVAGGILIPDVHVRLATVAKGAMVELFGQVKPILFGRSERETRQCCSGVFSKCTRMATMPILVSEALFHENKKIQLQYATLVSIEPLDL